MSAAEYDRDVGKMEGFPELEKDFIMFSADEGVSLVQLVNDS